MTLARLKSLRFSVPGEKVDPTTLAEGLRDLWTVIANRADVRIANLPEYVWAPPIQIASDKIPAVVLLGRAALSKSPVPVNGSNFVSWTWTGSAVRVDDIQGLTVGTSYDMSFVLIG